MKIACSHPKTGRAICHIVRALGTSATVSQVTIPPSGHRSEGTPISQCTEGRASGQSLRTTGGPPSPQLRGRSTWHPAPPCAPHTAPLAQCLAHARRRHFSVAECDATAR
eukprot:8072548-Pyramimonas_sp.AAC.1